MGLPAPKSVRELESSGLSRLPWFSLGEDGRLGFEDLGLKSKVKVQRFCSCERGFHLWFKVWGPKP